MCQYANMPMCQCANPDKSGQEVVIVLKVLILGSWLLILEF